jgi:hypothetical protein
MKKSLLLPFCFSLSLGLCAQTFEWAAVIGGPSGDSGQAIAVDSQGAVLATGFFSGSKDFDPGPGVFQMTAAASFDIFILKLDADRNFVWARRIGSTGNQRAYAIAVDAQDNVYITGDYSGTVDFDPGPGEFIMASSGAGDTETFVMKLNSNGDLIWAVQIAGPGQDQGYAIAVDGAGNVYTTGKFQGTTDFDPGPGVFELSAGPVNFGPYDLFISKLDANGEFLWAMQGGGSDGFGTGLAIDPAGNLFVTGGFSGTVDLDPGPGVFNLTNTITNGFILKLDAAGAFAWAIQFEGVARGTSIHVDGSGNVLTTGYFSNATDFDPGPGTDILTAAGYPATEWVLDIFVSKLTNDGDHVWARRMGGPGEDIGHSLTTDAAGNVYTTGYFSEVADMDPGAAVHDLTSAGNVDVFITRFTPGGDLVWARWMGGPNNDVGRGIAVDALGSVYTIGIFFGPADLDPDGLGYPVTGAEGVDIFIHKTAQDINTGLVDLPANTLSRFPNPAIESLTITTSGNAIGEVFIHDDLGRLVQQQRIAGPTGEVDLRGLSPGSYVVRVGAQSYKFLKR